MSLPDYDPNRDYDKLMEDIIREEVEDFLFTLDPEKTTFWLRENTFVLGKLPWPQIS